jgi:hypothetical protein
MGLLPGTFELGGGGNLLETSAITIFHGIKHSNPSFEKLYVDFFYKKSYLERVRFRTQSQHFQATDQKFWQSRRQIVLSLYSNFQLSGCSNVEKIGNRRANGRTDGQRNDFNRAHFFKNVL